METLIATLVKDFEDGRMNRRQLIGSLAALVMTAPAVTGVINHVSWGISPWDTEGVCTELERRGLSHRADMVGADCKSWHVLWVRSRFERAGLSPGAPMAPSSSRRS